MNGTLDGTTTSYDGDDEVIIGNANPAFSLGWRGSAKHWRVYEHAYLILAAISTPLVLSANGTLTKTLDPTRMASLARDREVRRAFAVRAFTAEFPLSSGA